MLGLPKPLAAVVPEVVGKLNVYAEEALMGFVAMKIMSVKWIESWRENFS
jgi:hypothetical protein